VDDLAVRIVDVHLDAFAERGGEHRRPGLRLDLVLDEVARQEDGPRLLDGRVPEVDGARPTGAGGDARDVGAVPVESRGTFESRYRPVLYQPMVLGVSAVMSVSALGTGSPENSPTSYTVWGSVTTFPFSSNTFSVPRMLTSNSAVTVAPPLVPDSM
jgi:hypothetical protein